MRAKKARFLRKHQVATRRKATWHGKPWLDEEKQYLRQFGHLKTAEELALMLGRTYAAVLNAGSGFKIDLRGNKTTSSSTRQPTQESLKAARPLFVSLQETPHRGDVVSKRAV